MEQVNDLLSRLLSHTNETRLQAEQQLNEMKTQDAPKTLGLLLSGLQAEKSEHQALSGVLVRKLFIEKEEDLQKISDSD